MRTIAEIKSIITADFMDNTTMAQAYGFTRGQRFDDCFSVVSIESILFYIVATAIWALECLMDEHKKDVEAEVEQIIPHRPKWYRDKVLAFMTGKSLVTDTDYYDTSGMDEAEINEAHVVKYAAATESADTALLTIKVAGETNGELAPLASDVETQLRAYITEVKDAGVRIALVNKPADGFRCGMDIYYDTMIPPQVVRERVENAIKAYLCGLPFNGEYTNMAMVDKLQVLEGVKIAEVKSVMVSVNGESTTTAIDARYTPVAGYMKAEQLNINMIPYNEQV